MSTETPENNNPRVTDVDINKEMREAYLQYSMSVIVGRALPDVRDGLKPVHRRSLFAMHELSNTHDKPYKKSARIVGDVIGKYHPHGEASVYDAIVRMAQDFSLRYPLVDGQGNFGSIDGDSPAAQRYTEVRMTRLAEDLLEDLEKDTVRFELNYDDSLLMPAVLPAKFPNLLVNGSAGIAVGMATNIPPHNLGEVCDACITIIKNPQTTMDQLLKIIPGPDFPTAGIISGRSGVLSAYREGRGIITIKAVAEVVQLKGDREEIIITEIPYQVNKAKLIESIAELVKDKKIEGISDIRDESSREGMRIVVLIKKGENAQVVLNRLYKFTQLQTSFGIIMLALDARNQPVTFNLRSMLDAFIEHRKDVITRRSIFELKKAQDREHLLLGLSKAIDQINEVIATIRAAKEAAVAKADLISKFSFSEKQAQAILEMRLQRLTGLERQKILDELKEVGELITYLKKVLADINEIFKIIINELETIKSKNESPRRTKIETETGDMEEEDLIAREDVVVSMTNAGYIKRISKDEYRLQKRGGKGLKGADQADEDFVSKLFSANTHTTLCVFSDRGKLYWQKVYRLPQGTRTSKGRAIANVVSLSAQEKVRAILPVEEFSAESYVIMLTEKGTIKKTSLEEFSRPRPSGIIALTIDLEDNLMGAGISDGKQNIFIVTSEGMSIRFDESDVRPMGRNARGVRGISLGEKDKVVCMEVIPADCKDTVLMITENGYGKRSPLDEYRVQNRSGVGIITQKVTDKVGALIAARRVTDNDNVIITTDKGQSIRIKVAEISVMGRNTQGVRLINLKPGEKVTDMALIQDEDEENETSSPPSTTLN